MKIIYDSNKPRNQRIEFITDSGESSFDFHCFRIQLDDGTEVAEIGCWGDVKKRKAIINDVRGMPK